MVRRPLSLVRASSLGPYILRPPASPTIHQPSATIHQSNFSKIPLLPYLPPLFHPTPPYLMKTFIIIMLALMTQLPTVAQTPISDELQQLFYQGYLTSSKAPWEKAIAKIKADATLSKADRLYALTEAQSGLLVYTMANQDEATFETVADDMEENLEKLLSLNNKDARAHALLAGLYGTTVSFNNWKGMYLGPKGEKQVDQALQTDPKNPFAWAQRGNARLFTPAMFGGDVDEAVTCFEKAAQYHEQQSIDLTYNWRYLNTLAWLGIAYQKTGNASAAVETFQKALNIAPNFRWVERALLPKALAQASAQ